eukprot:MONOS_2007.1-p1 / transcript=MONOS_2007.1 / gene=MONOS_2007 / organism=Monocercomonoides_exilis_PA203 / gene_product=unspecified product / transcript_product=unspecified product / location=Mono_scaffold00038:183701-184575(+) / protein_length=205 / sequence_SO=supercontig / SO=protein_coding / is_pseudo=false
MNSLAISNAKISEGCAVSVASNASTFQLKQSSYQNITRDSFGPCWSIAAFADLTDACMSSCVFDGAASTSELRANCERSEELCQWSGSMVDLQNCTGIGDGLKENSSLWVLDLGCSLSEIASERASPFFNPQLASVKSRQQGRNLLIDLAGSLLLLCGLSLQVNSFDGMIHMLQVYPHLSEEFAGEIEILEAIPSSIVTTRMKQ